MARFNQHERVFLNRVAWTMKNLNMGMADAMKHVLGRDAVIAKFLKENAAAREHLMRGIYQKIRGGK